MAFFAGDPKSIVTSFNDGSIDAVCRLSIETQAIAGAHDSCSPCEKVLLKMVAREETVAIGEQQIWGFSSPHAVVATECGSESAMCMRDPFDGEIDGSGKASDDPLGLVSRSVVSDDDLEFSGNALLQ
jgi:hypothetical protein